MNKSSALHEPAHIRARRTPLTILAMAAALALAVPTGASAAPGAASQVAPAAALQTPVSSIPVATVAEVTKPKLRVKRSSARQVKGETRVKLTIRVSVGGKAVRGKVKIYNGKKHLKTKRLTKGKATYKLPKSLKKGTRKIKVTFVPKASSATTASSSAALASTSKTVRVKVISQSAAIKKEALKHRGVRYRYGGSSPRTGFDCSGFVRYVYKKAGIANLPTTSSAQRRVGKVVSRKKAKVGDIIWSPGHVGIYLGGNKQIDAPRPGKTIQVRSIWQSNPVFINL